jgi:hypothetical protein
MVVTAHSRVQSSGGQAARRCASLVGSWPCWMRWLRPHVRAHAWSCWPPSYTSAHLMVGGWIRAMCTCAGHMPHWGSALLPSTVGLTLLVSCHDRVIPLMHAACFVRLVCAQMSRKQHWSPSWPPGGSAHLQGPCTVRCATPRQGWPYAWAPSSPALALPPLRVQPTQVRGRWRGPGSGAVNTIAAARLF